MRTRLTWNLARRLSLSLLVFTLCGSAMAQSGPLVLERPGRVISLEPYAANIVRVTMSTGRAAATAPGYGFVATPASVGWTHERDAEGYDVFRSRRMVVRVAPDLPLDQQPQPMPLDALNLELRHHYFGGGGGNGPNDGGLGPHNDALVVTTPEGKVLLHMRTWMMAPKRPEAVATDTDPTGYFITAAFDSPPDEHYYGLGQQQKGWMDLRDHQIVAGTITKPSAERMFVSRSWYRAAAMESYGITHRNHRGPGLQWPKCLVI